MSLIPLGGFIPPNACIAPLNPSLMYAPLKIGIVYLECDISWSASELVLKAQIAVPINTRVKDIFLKILILFFILARDRKE